MSKSFFRMQLPAIIIACALLITLSAWKENKFAQAQQITSDTLPKKNEKQIKDFDDALKELERAQIELEHNLKNMPPIDFDGEKIRAEVEKAMKDFDGEKLKLQAEQAMKQVDMQKVKEQMEAAMKQIDMEKIKLQIAEAMKELDAQKLRLQAQEALAKVDMEKIKVQMEEIKKVQVPKIEAEMKKIKPQIDEALKKAKVEIEKAKQDIKEYKAFEDALEKDGLINKKENYSIEHKDGQLIINGKVQPQAVYNKHRSFLEKHKQFKWEKDDDGLDLDND
jgi:hypothetical protein